MKFSLVKCFREPKIVWEGIVLLSFKGLVDICLTEYV